jgi:hypothetical protein
MSPLFPDHNRVAREIFSDPNLLARERRLR